MSMDFNPGQLTVLVVDRAHQQRVITQEQLRLMGFGAVLGEPGAAQAWEALERDRPDMMLLEWLEPIENTLEFVRRIRQGEDSPNRAIPIFILSGKGALSDVERARAAGCDGYLRKPISALAIQERLKVVALKPRQFIRTASYVGPCRRRRDDPDYAGPWRREADLARIAAARAERLRQAMSWLDAASRAFAPTQPAELIAAAQSLADVAEEASDLCLGLGSRELLRYLQFGGASAEPDVVRTHIAALNQLAWMPSEMPERGHVADSLQRMIEKKLKTA